MENEITNEKLENDLKYIKDYAGFVDGDREMALADLKEGLEAEHIAKYCGKNVKQEAKPICSIVYRYYRDPSKLDKYLEKRASAEKLKLAFNYNEQGIPLDFIDEHFKDDDKFFRLVAIWNQYSAMQNAKKKEAQSVENSNPVTETVKANQNAASKKNKKRNRNHASEVVEVPKEPEARSTVINNGFTFEQMKELALLMNKPSEEKESQRVPDDTEQRMARFEKKMESMMESFMNQAMTMIVGTAAVKKNEEISERPAKEEVQKETNDESSVVTENVTKNEVKESSNIQEGKMPRNADGYIASCSDKRGGSLYSFPVEIEKRKTSGLGGLVSSLCFKKRYQRSLVSMAIAGQLDKNQLHHIATAIKSGLSENQLCDLIESRAPAERMPELIEIAVLEKRMGYAG